MEELLFNSLLFMGFYCLYSSMFNPSRRCTKSVGIAPGAVPTVATTQQATKAPATTAIEPKLTTATATPNQPTKAIAQTTGGVNTTTGSAPGTKTVTATETVTATATQAQLASPVPLLAADRDTMTTEANRETTEGCQVHKEPVPGESDLTGASPGVALAAPAAPTARQTTATPDTVDSQLTDWQTTPTTALRTSHSTTRVPTQARTPGNSTTSNNTKRTDRTKTTTGAKAR